MIIKVSERNHACDPRTSRQANPLNGNRCGDTTIAEEEARTIANTVSVRTLVVQLVSNYYIKDRDLPEVKKDIYKRVKRDVPKNVAVQIRLDTIFKIFWEIIKLVNADRRGRRYGHPVLDIAREMNRYVNPKLTYAGKEKDKIIQDLRAMFDQSLEG